MRPHCSKRDDGRDIREGILRALPSVALPMRIRHVTCRSEGVLDLLRLLNDLVCGSQSSRSPILVTDAPLGRFEHADQHCALCARSLSVSTEDIGRR